VGCNLSILLRVDAEFFIRDRRVVRFVPRRCGSTIGATHAPLRCSKCPYDLIALLSFIFVSNATFVTSRICSFSSDCLTSCRLGMHEPFRIGLSEFSERPPQATCPSSGARARSMKFSSSRILPGQVPRSSAPSLPR